MASAFLRTVRSLDADRHGINITGMGIAIIMLGVWGWWFFFSAVNIYEVSPQGRLEVSQPLSHVKSPVSGAVLSNAMRLGADIRKGDMLLTLESEAERIRWDEATRALQSLENELQVLQAAIHADTTVAESEENAARAALAEVKAKSDEMDTATTQASAELLALQEMERAGTSTGEARARVEGARARIAQLEHEREARREELGMLEASLVAASELAESRFLQAEQALNRTYENHQRLERIATARPGDITEQELQDAEYAYLEAKSERDKAALDIDQVSADGAARRKSMQSTILEFEGRIADQVNARQEAEAALARLVAQAQLDLRRADAELQKLRAAKQSHEQTVARIEADLAAKIAQRATRTSQFDRERATLQGRVQAARSAVEGAAFELERRSLHAPCAGRIAEVASIPLGSLVSPDMVLAVIVPEAPLVATAWFDPSEALGRIAVGQHAQIRLDGFPWTQYGTIEARVSEVSTEAREGKLRVTLELLPTSSPQAPQVHGLSGSVEIAVESVSPLELVLRIAGKRSQTASPKNNTQTSTPTQGSA